METKPPLPKLHVLPAGLCPTCGRQLTNDKNDVLISCLTATGHGAYDPVCQFQLPVCRECRPALCVCKRPFQKAISVTYMGREGVVFLHTEMPGYHFLWAVYAWTRGLFPPKRWLHPDRQVLLTADKKDLAAFIRAEPKMIFPVWQSVAVRDLRLQLRAMRDWEFNPYDVLDRGTHICYRSLTVTCSMCNTRRTIDEMVRRQYNHDKRRKFVCKNCIKDCLENRVTPQKKTMVVDWCRAAVQGQLDDNVVIL